MSDFSAKCPKCNQELLISSEFIGQQIECPRCQCSFSVNIKHNNPGVSNFNSFPRKNYSSNALPTPAINPLSIVMGGAAGLIIIISAFKAIYIADTLKDDDLWIVFQPILTAIPYVAILVGLGEIINLLTQIKNKK